MSLTKGASHTVLTRKTRPKTASLVDKAAGVPITATKMARAHEVADLLFTTHKGSSGREHLYVLYVRSKGVDDFVARVYDAEPLRLIETERKGVAGVFLKDLSKRMEIPAQRMFDILGVPKATAEKKVAAGDLIAGNGGRAALGMARLLGIAREIVKNSTAPEAQEFDSAKWLGKWLERPQPALGGRKPAELIDTPTGLEVVAKLLGAIESGAYQ